MRVRPYLDQPGWYGLHSNPKLHWFYPKTCLGAPTQHPNKVSRAAASVIVSYFAIELGSGLPECVLEPARRSGEGWMDSGEQS